MEADGGTILWAAVAASAAALSAIVNVWQLWQRARRDKGAETRKQAEHEAETRREEARRSIDLLWNLQEALLDLLECVERAVVSGQSRPHTSQELKRCARKARLVAGRVRDRRIGQEAEAAIGRCEAGPVDSVGETAGFVEECADMIRLVDTSIRERIQELDTFDLHV